MAHTLLLADDSVTIQRVIELTFADEDVRVVAVSDGDQAIARIEAAPPDIILADIGMPGKNGYEVAQHVKRNPRLAHIPVVLLTGAFEPVDQARAAAMGCEGVLAKPFEPQLVIGRVRELLARGASAKPVSPAAGHASPPRQPPPPFEDPLFGAAAPAAPAQPSAPDLDNYFDRLDEAFASLVGNAPAAGAQPARPEIDWFQTSATDAPARDEAWDIALPPAEPVRPLLAEADRILPSAAVLRPDRSAALGPPEAAPAAPASVPIPSSATDRTSAPAATPIAEPAPIAGQTAVAPLPPLAEAFAALLAAEQQAGPPDAPPVWPASAPAPSVTDEMIEAIATRVLARLSDAAVRERASEMVGAIAERLVREEIARIKAEIS
ncbi:MAG: response regulator [Acidobacteria bacterium]|nr:response regulator [Acidobacteriota bacterium]